LGYLVSFYLLQKVGVSALILKYLLASGGTVVCIAAINYFWKISAHMASIGAFLGLLVVLSIYLQTDLRFLIILGMLVAGLTGSARLFANAHTFSQLVAGFCLGFAWIFFLFQ
jgi:membrane-associated phospholipid phosphatase